MNDPKIELHRNRVYFNFYLYSRRHPVRLSDAQRLPCALERSTEPALLGYAYQRPKLAASRSWHRLPSGSRKSPIIPHENLDTATSTPSRKKLPAAASTSATLNLIVTGFSPAVFAMLRATPPRFNHQVRAAQCHQRQCLTRLVLLHLHRKADHAAVELDTVFIPLGVKDDAAPVDIDHPFLRQC